MLANAGYFKGRSRMVWAYQWQAIAAHTGLVACQSDDRGKGSSFTIPGMRRIGIGEAGLAGQHRQLVIGD